MSHEKGVPKSSIPSLAIGGIFPSNDVPRSSSLESARYWLSECERIQHPKTLSQKLKDFTESNEDAWRTRHANTGSLATYDAAIETTKEWDRQTTTGSMGTYSEANKSFRLVHALMSSTNVIPAKYHDFSKDISDISDTYVDFSDAISRDPEIKKGELAKMFLEGKSINDLNRAILFGRFAWNCMAQHNNVYGIFSRLHNIAVRGYSMTTPTQRDLSKSGMGLMYTLSAHTRIREPLDRISGVRINPHGTNPHTDSIMFEFNGDLAPDRKYEKNI